MKDLNASARLDNSTIDLIAANHTGRELALMLAGSKPLAVFHYDISCLPNEEIVPEAAFQPYVASGKFVRHEVTFSHGFDTRMGRESLVKYVLFA